MKIKTIKAFAVVNKKNPKIDPMDIYKTDKDLAITKDEQIIQVEIKPIVK